MNKIDTEHKLSAPSGTILCGDALTMLKTLPGESVDTCVCSPPYFGLRDYGHAEQIGLEETPEKYVDRLTEVFQEVRRVLVSTGTLWLVIADSYAGSSKGALSRESSQKIKTKQSYKFTLDNPAVQMPKTWQGIKAKDMVGIPWMTAFALRNSGWWLRSDCIWWKPNAMPQSVKDRPTSSYEHVFLFAKSYKYYYDYEAVKEPVADGTIERMKRGMSNGHKYSNGAPGQTAQSINKPRKNRTGDDADMPLFRNMRDVMVISTKAYREAHFATFPVELATRCIKAGCPAGGIVLDPFMGSGTTGVAALMQGRRYFGIDINREYCNLAQRRLEMTAQEIERGGRKKDN